MLDRHEAAAIGLAASTAPVVTCVAFGSTRLFVITAAVAYLAAFAIGAPLFAYLRHRRWRLAPRSWLAAAVAGVVAGLAVVTFVHLAFPPRDLLAALSLIGICAGWGLGLGVVAGVALWLLLRRQRATMSGA